MRVTGVEVDEDLLILCFLGVVEFLGDPCPELADQRLRIEAGEDHAEDRAEHGGVVEIGLDDLGDAWVLDLHGHLDPCPSHGAMHLSDRSRCHGNVVELAEMVP